MSAPPEKPPIVKSVNDAKNIISWMLRIVIFIFLFWLVKLLFSFLEPPSVLPELSVLPPPPPIVQKATLSSTQDSSTATPSLRDRIERSSGRPQR